MKNATPGGLSMAQAKQTHPITVAQYEHSFEGYPGLRDELINGRIVMSPKAKPLHQQVSKNIERLLYSACERTDYTANGNSNIEFPASNSAPAPDVFIVGTSRWKEAMRKGTYIDVPPLLAVEVLSPSEDVSERISIYLDGGVSSVWVVDPRRRIVLVYGGSEKRQYGEHTEIDLPFPLNGSVGIDDIFFGLPEFSTAIR
jgi:Uma2 family endonuclease